MSHFPIYAPRGISIVRGENATVWDESGRSLIDCIGGIGVASIGHANEAVAEAISVQARTVLSVPGAFTSPVRDSFVETLTSLMPEGLDRVFLCNSGAESVEAAIKFARYTTKRTRIISAVRSYHGRTLGALSATHSPAYRDPFGPLVPGFEHVPFNDIEKLEAAIDDDTAAILLEPIQGEGGVRMADTEYLKAVRALCDEKGIILIIDEVQTGFCRTGTMFRFEHHGVVPDILCLAKAIAGGVPMGAVVCNRRIEAPTGKHGSTFGGNPLSCAAGTAAIKYMLEHDLAGEAERKGRHAMERLSSIDSRSILDVRGAGLLIGIELRIKARPIVDELAERGVLVMPTGPRIIRLLPPLTIPDEQLDAAIDAIEDVIANPIP